MVEEWGWFFQINVFHRYFPCSVLPAILISSTYTDKNNPFSLCTSKHSQLETFSQPYFNRIVLPKDDRTDFAQEERLDHPHWTMILAICALVDVSKYRDILTYDFSMTLVHHPFLTCGKADTASAAWPEHPGSLDIMSMTLAAVIWDADDPCFANTAKDPESSFTVSPRSTTRPMYFWNCGSSSEFLRWQRSRNDKLIPCFGSEPCRFIRCLFIQYREPCETCPRIWQFSISINIPAIVDIFLQHHIQRCIGSSGNVKNEKWIFLLYSLHHWSPLFCF